MVVLKGGCGLALLGLCGLGVLVGVLMFVAVLPSC